MVFTYLARQRSSFKSAVIMGLRLKNPGTGGSGQVIRNWSPGRYSYAVYQERIGSIQR